MLDKPGQPPIIITTPDEQALRLMEEDIRQLRAQADIVVASYHWGISRHASVIDYQRTLARSAIDAGADVVIGHGTHVLQPIEFWRGRPIFYGLANYTFDWWKQNNAPNGLLARVVVRNKKLTAVSCVPVQRNAKNNPVLLDPNIGTGRELFEELQRLSADSSVELRIEGKEILVTEGDEDKASNGGH